MEKKKAFSKNGAGSTGSQHVEEFKLIYSYTHLKYKVQGPDTLNLIEEKMGKSIEHMDIGEKFLNRMPMASALRSRIDKWDLIKLQIL